MSCSSKPFFSLVLATINRKEEVANYLKHLSKQQFNSFELIVIDQNKQNLIDNVIDDYKDLINIQHIKTEVKGLSAARNLGMGVCSGKYISFPDDDCHYGDDFLQNVHEYLTKNKYDLVSFATRDPLTEEQLPYTPLKEATIIDSSNIFYAVTAIGLFLKLENLDSCFDERLGAGTKFHSSEEFDFVFKLLVLEKYKCFYEPSIHLYHPKLPANSYKKIFDNSKGHGAYLRKNFTYSMKFALNAMLVVIVKPTLGIILSIISFNKPEIIKYYGYLTGRLYGFIKYHR